MSRRVRFFGGKGGVGKTTCAASAAVAAAEAGARVLLASTDPAHSLGDALDRRLGAAPHPVTTRRGSLDAVELDADAALARWLARRRRPLRTLLERGTYLDARDVDRFLALSLPGVDELLGLLELARVADAGAYDEVIVDTAPTGHTLRMLATPATLQRVAAVLDEMQAKHRFLATSLGGAARADAASALVDEIAADGQRLEQLLRDPLTAFTWVMVPEALALAETRDAVASLDGADIRVDRIVVNRVMPRVGRSCATCGERQRTERAVLAAAGQAFADRGVHLVPDLSSEPRGVTALRRMARFLAAPARWPAPRGRQAAETPAAGRSMPGPPTAVLDAVAPPGVRLLVFAGKGGVGKTTCATATALGLARRHPGRRTLLLSTDPAHSISDVLAMPAGDTELAVPGVAGLTIREMDATRAFAERRARYQAGADRLFAALTRGSRFDIAFDRAVVRDLIDLAPPGLDELFGILAVSDALFGAAGSRRDVVVVDTAPTGHALRLLRMPDEALAWVRALLAILLEYRKLIGLGDLGADLLDTARDLRRLAELLRDPALTRVVAVARPAALARLETRRLLAGLDGLHIPVGAVVVNAVAGTCAHDAHAREQAQVLEALRRDGRSAGRPRYRIIRAPAVVPPPRGVAALAQWLMRWAPDGATRPR
jgi:arsenite-transporting ATPase